MRPRARARSSHTWSRWRCSRRPRPSWSRARRRSPRRGTESASWPARASCGRVSPRGARVKAQRGAARRLLKLVGAAGWSAADLAYGSRGAATAARWRKEAGATVEDADKGWLQELAAYAQAQKIAAPPADLDVLVQGPARGLPPKTHLLLVAEALPPRHPLARVASEQGATVKRKAERRGRGIETLDLLQPVAQELGPHKKRLARDAENELKQRLGDDRRLIAAELGKRVLAVG